jgi:hypothetical protein
MNVPREIAERHGTSPVLMDRPQRLGILPTWSFWTDPAVRTNPIVAKIIQPVRGAIIVGGFMAWGLLILPLISIGTGVGRAAVSGVAGGVIAGVAGLLTFGAAERFLRRRIIEGRRRTEELAARLEADERAP